MESQAQTRVKVGKLSAPKKVEKVNVKGMQAKRYTFDGTLQIIPFEGKIREITGEFSFETMEENMISSRIKKLKIMKPQVRIKVTKPSTFHKKVDEVDVKGLSYNHDIFYGTIEIVTTEGENKAITGEFSYQDYEKQYGFQLKKC